MKKLYHKEILFVVLFMLCFGSSRAQIFSVGTSGVTLKSNTIFSADGLILTPSADITMTSVSLSRNVTASHTPSQPYISRVYRFSGTTAPYSGRVQINYLDPSELNGIPEANLMLNIHNGTLWQAYTGTVDATNNNVISNPFTNVALNELTLANVLTPLPLNWLSFNAFKQKTSVFLQWNTANEQNTKDFTVQFSTNAIRWNDLTTIPSSTLNSIVNTYNYTHTKPIKGINYYRIIQTDLNGRSSYSIVRTLKYTDGTDAFYVLNNPVKNDMLQVQVNSSMMLGLYTAEGKLLLQQQASSGLQNIDVSKYAGGLYLLKGNSTSIKIVVQ